MTAEPERTTSQLAAGEVPQLAASEVARPKRAPLNAVGEERPAFLLDFPEDPELEPLIEAFEAGNFARVRSEAPLLAARTEDAAVREAALELRRRTEPDRLLVALLGMCLALFVFIVAWVYTR